MLRLFYYGRYFSYWYPGARLFCGGARDTSWPREKIYLYLSVTLYHEALMFSRSASRLDGVYTNAERLPEKRFPNKFADSGRIEGCEAGDPKLASEPAAWIFMVTYNRWASIVVSVFWM